MASSPKEKWKKKKKKKKKNPEKYFKNIEIKWK